MLFATLSVVTPAIAQPLPFPWPLPPDLNLPFDPAQLMDQVCLTPSADVCVFLHPGVQDEYKPGWSFTLGTIWNDVNPAQQRQVLDKYLDASILASGSDSIGDLQFDIQVTAPINWVRIWVPPEFQWMHTNLEESVWTDITNDYNLIDVSTRGPYDTVGPNWKRVTIGQDNFVGSGGSSTIWPGIYHVRIFNLRAPERAGIYHFKIFTSTGSVGAPNYPFLVVKTELNPAMVRVRVDGPAVGPGLAGWVLAVGTTPEGRSVEGVGYFGPNDWDGTAYVVWLLGLAAGTYTFTAEANGYNPTESDRYTLDPGQSLIIFIAIWPSPTICFTVWSKHGTGTIPWHNLWQLPYGTNNPTILYAGVHPRDIIIDLYDSENNLVAFWFSDAYGIRPGAPHPNEIDPTVPSQTSYRVCPPSWSHWDGHVPMDGAWYIAGFPRGQYTVEAFVTGYIMDEPDAYQRTFTLAGASITIQFDLRRTNWIETVVHLPAPLSAGGHSMVLTAEDADGNERAAITWPAQDYDGDFEIDGVDATTWTGHGAYGGGIVLEGWSTYWLTLGGALSNPAWKDYGLNPTPSSHSAGAVTLGGNPYTVRMYFTDMGNAWLGIDGTGWYQILGGDPQISVGLCNSRQSLSFSVVNTWVWISLRSVDFEMPAHSRPWTFPGSEIWVDFVDTATGEVVDTLDPTVYGLFQDPGFFWFTPPPLPATVGGFLIPGVDYTPAGIRGTLLNPWHNLPAPFPAGFTYGVTPYDFDNFNDPGLHEHVAVNYYGTDPGFGALWLGLLLRPTRLPAGQYTFNVYTHGYVMRRIYTFNVPFGGVADIEMDLIQGGQLRVCLTFRDEGIPTGFNGFARVEVFNEAGDLVGASIYGQAEPNIWTTMLPPAPFPVGPFGGYLLYNNGWANMPADDHDWLRGSFFHLTETFLKEPAQGAGLGVINADGINYPSFSPGQRAFWLTQFATGVAGVGAGLPIPGNPVFGAWPWARWPNLLPSDATRLMMWDTPLIPAPFRWQGQPTCFDVYGFYWQFGGAAVTWAGGWPTVSNAKQNDYGLAGSIDIPGWEGSGGGLYTVKVWAFDPRGPNGWYDFVAPGDDWRMYEMAAPVSGIEVPWGGATQLTVVMNNLASLRGTVYWYDMFGNLRPLPWAQVTATPGPAYDQYPAYATGNGAIGLGLSDPSGAYVMWLPAGSHDVSVTTSEASQVWAPEGSTFSVVVSDGWVGNNDVNMTPSGTPIPELPPAAVPLAFLAAIAASLWLLRKRNLVNVRVVIK